MTTGKNKTEQKQPSKALFFPREKLTKTWSFKTYFTKRYNLAQFKSVHHAILEFWVNYY